MENPLNERIRRIYAAIGEAFTTDPNEFKSVTFHVGGDTFATRMDFRAGLSTEQLQNIVFTAVHNTANLRDHMKRWARQNGKDPNIVDDVVEASFEMKVIIDLSNRDKHGGPPRDGGLSGLSPDLTGFRRALILPKVEEGQEKPSVTVSLFGDGPEVQFQSGAHVLTNADIVDASGKTLGDAMSFIEVAVSHLEQTLSKLGSMIDGQST